MQILNTDNEHVDIETSLTQNIPHTRPKLYMKWEKQFDGKRYTLVARWIVEH